MYLDHTNPDSIVHNTTSVITEITVLHRHMVKNSAAYPDGLEIRLCSDADGVLWFATGDVQYDTEHGYACEACTLTGAMTAADVAAAAKDLVEGLVAQIASLAQIATE